jgi:hypothetical protein
MLDNAGYVNSASFTLEMGPIGVEQFAEAA